MQTLFSRVAQVRGACRCPQCAPRVNGISRRATASATKRIPRYLTSSTFWYSGIFAAAATLDAGVKQQRREQWNQAIAEVKQELAEPTVIPQEQGKPCEVPIADGETNDVDGEETLLFKPFGEDEGLEGLKYTDGRTSAEWPASTGAPLDRFLAPNSIYADESLRRVGEVSRWSPKKLALAETATDILLLRLMHDFRRQRDRDPDLGWLPEELHHAQLPTPAQIINRVLEKQERLCILRHSDASLVYCTTRDAPEERVPVPEDDVPLCRYCEDSDLRFRSVQRDLNYALQKLFRLHAQERISMSSMIGSIVHNLRCSSAPPNTDTYNILLLGFSRAGEHDRFRHTLTAFRRCSMRPNEITLATILNHYAKFDDPKQFAHWLSRMRGAGGGLALARSDVAFTEESAKRLMQHPDQPWKVIQLPHHNPLVFGAIIAGVLKFSGFEASLRICQSMGQEGWGLCMAGLTPLLHDCMRRGDWASGTTIWNQIQALKVQSKRKEDSRWLTERIRLDAFAAMLRLCIKCGQQVKFDEVWAMAMRSHPGAIEKMTKLTRDAAAKKSQDVVEETIRKAAARSSRSGSGSATPRGQATERIATAESPAVQSYEPANAKADQAEVSPGSTSTYACDLPTLDHHTGKFAQRVVLTNTDVLAISPAQDQVPSQQAGIWLDTPSRRAEAGAGGSGLPALPLRPILCEPGLSGNQNSADSFPVHQSTMHFLSERDIDSVLAIKSFSYDAAPDDVSREQASPGEPADYFELAEPGDIPARPWTAAQTPDEPSSSGGASIDRTVEVIGSRDDAAVARQTVRKVKKKGLIVRKHQIGGGLDRNAETRWSEPEHAAKGRKRATRSMPVGAGARVQELRA